MSDVRLMSRVQLLGVPVRDDPGLFTSLVLVPTQEATRSLWVVGVRLMQAASTLLASSGELLIDGETYTVGLPLSDALHVFPRSILCRTGLFRVREQGGRLCVSTDHLPHQTVQEMWNLERAYVR